MKNDISTLKSYHKNNINLPDKIDEEEEKVILKNKLTKIPNNLVNSNLETFPNETRNFVIETEDEIKEDEDEINKNSLKTIKKPLLLYKGFNDENEYIINTQENEINNNEINDNLIKENLNEEKENINFDINEIDNSEESKKEEKICNCVSREEDLFRKGWTFIKISSYVAYKQSSREEKKKFKKWKKVCGLKDEQNSMSQEDIDVKNQSEKSEIFMNQDESIVKELGFIYALEMKDCYDHLHNLELIEKGRNIPVENLDDYVNKRIDILVGLYYPFVKKIQEGIFTIFEKSKINVFTSNELELMVNGRPFIDLEEWQEFTLYKGAYNKDHIVIKWFWEILSEFTQKELSNLLLFATGASRVPLGGFEVLESNGGNIYKFTIEYINYDNYHKNFIKAHTCFNRIDLPCYPKKDELEEALRFVSEREMWGFGIE